MLKQIRKFATQAMPNVAKLSKISKETMRILCGSSKLAESIINETKISTDHLTPEISLNLLTPECRLYKSFSSEHLQSFNDKLYWGYYYACAQGLCRYLLDNPKKIEGRSVLDFRDGCGACAVAAMKCSARYVLINEESETCCCAARLNGMLNNCPMERFITYNPCLIGYPIKEDIILFNDVNRYQQQNERISRWFDSLHQDGKLILIAEAHSEDRWISPDANFENEFMHQQACYRMPKSIWQATGCEKVTIWKY